MGPGELLADGFGRVRELAGQVVDGLSPDDLVWAPAPGANTIGWLVWHLSRIQDAQVAEVAGEEQVWEAGGWHDRLGLPYEKGATGYGQEPAEVALLRVEAADLVAYHQPVFEATTRFLERLDAAALDRVVDRRWDPPVTLGVRLMSILDDDLQHAGQAAYVRGLREGLHERR